MKRLKKLKGRSGFSLAEMLLAVLILVMVAGIVAAGIPTVKNVYDKVVVSANAQVLLSTTVNALRDELGTAWDVSKGLTDTALTYFSADTGAKTELWYDESMQAIVIREYAGVSDIGVAAQGTPRRLVSEAASANQGLYAKCDDIVYSNGIVTFKALKVCRGDKVFAAMNDGESNLAVRVFSAKEDDAVSVQG